jgi:hypothetical protein
MTRYFLKVCAITLALGLVGVLTEGAEAETSPIRKVSRSLQSRCMMNTSVEKVMRSRFRAAVPLGKMPREVLLDTLSIAGSSFTLVTNDSICAIARNTYANIYHGTDSARKAMMFAAFPAVMVVQLRPDRIWISAIEFDDYQLYRRVLVDSSWRLVSKRF